MISIQEFETLRPEQLLNRDIRAEADVDAAVDEIIQTVRTQGDAALRAYANSRRNSVRRASSSAVLVRL